MKTHVLLNAGAGDFYGRPVLYLKDDMAQFISIAKNLHKVVIYYAYCRGNIGFYRTLEGATRHIARAELGQLPHTRWK